MCEYVPKRITDVDFCKVSFFFFKGSDVGEQIFQLQYFFPLLKKWVGHASFKRFFLFSFFCCCCSYVFCVFLKQYGKKPENINIAVWGRTKRNCRWFETRFISHVTVQTLVLSVRQKNLALNFSVVCLVFEVSQESSINGNPVEYLEPLLVEMPSVSGFEELNLMWPLFPSSDTKRPSQVNSFPLNSFGYNQYLIQLQKFERIILALCLVHIVLFIGWVVLWKKNCPVEEKQSEKLKRNNSENSHLVKRSLKSISEG